MTLSWVTLTHTETFSQSVGSTYDHFYVTDDSRNIYQPAPSASEPPLFVLRASETYQMSMMTNPTAKSLVLVMGSLGGWTVLLLAVGTLLSQTLQFCCPPSRAEQQEADEEANEKQPLVQRKR